MDIHILSLFPDMFTGPFQDSIIKRAISNKLVNIHIHNIRDYALGQHKVVDDYPFGGGGGMVMKPEPLFAALESIRADLSNGKSTEEIENIQTILLSPQGLLLSQGIAKGLSELKDLILVCGHYEGIDQRVIDQFIDIEISIGDYILSGGEIPAMVLVDALVRLIPGAIGNQASIDDDSHSSGFLQFPQYTRPSTFRGMTVPPVLLSGDHNAIGEWRRDQSMHRTRLRRPDMLINTKDDSK
jgi:tRNA (guanine37-N1)-methyltransferase